MQSFLRVAEEKQYRKEVDFKEDKKKKKKKK
jgi:hypothetical protein